MQDLEENGGWQGWPARLTWILLAALLLAALLPAMLLPAGSPRPLAAADNPPLPTFVDVTEAAGIRFLHSFGDEEMSNIIESAGSGCAFLDYDNDGWLDLYLVNCSYLPLLNERPVDDRHLGAANHLYRNNGDGSFTDVTQETGCGDTGYGMGCVVGDIDNDGDSDIFITNFGRNTLYRNDGSDGNDSNDGNDGKNRFTDITERAGVADTLAGIGCAFLDFDNDGLLDLYVGNYLEFDPEYRLYYAADEFPGPLSYVGQRDILYRHPRRQRRHGELPLQE
jgi:hypothetical protein